MKLLRCRPIVHIRVNRQQRMNAVNLARKEKEGNRKRKEGKRGEEKVDKHWRRLSGAIGGLSPHELQPVR